MSHNTSCIFFFFNADKEQKHGHMHNIHVQCMYIVTFWTDRDKKFRTFLWYAHTYIFMYMSGMLCDCMFSVYTYDKSTEWFKNP